MWYGMRTKSIGIAKPALLFEARIRIWDHIRNLKRAVLGEKKKKRLYPELVTPRRELEQ